MLACYAAAREAVERARDGGGPTLIEAKVTRLTAHSSDDQQTKYRSADDLEAGKAHDPLPIFRAQLRDGGVLTDEIEAALAAEIAGARGGRDGLRRGRAGPGSRRRRWTGSTASTGRARRRRPGTATGAARRGRPLMAIRTFIEAIRDGMAEEMRRDESVIVLGEDVGKKGGVFLATDGLWAEFGDDRVIDTPLTESMIVGASIGAAINGLRPIAEIQFADFIHPAFNQLVSEAARMRYRSNSGFAVPMVIRAPYGGGVHGALYHSQSVEAFFTHVPGLKVVIPSTPYDAKGLLRTAIRDDDPVLFFEHKKMYRSVRGEVPDGEYTVPLGSAAIRRTGRPGHGRRLRADGALRAGGGRARGGGGDRRRGGRPALAAAARPRDAPVVGAQDRQVPRRLRGQPVRRVRGGDRAIVAEEAFDYLDGPVSRIAGPDVPGVPYNHALEDWFMLSPAKIADAIRKLAAY